MRIDSFRWNPKSQELFLSVSAGRTPELSLESELSPADGSFRRNQAGRIVIPLRPGEQRTFQLKFR